MNAILILDKDAKTGLSEDIKERILKILKEKAHRIEVSELRRIDVAPCLGCLLCLTKHVGICVIRDRIAEIRNNNNRYDMRIRDKKLLFGYACSRPRCRLDNPIQPSWGSIN